MSPRPDISMGPAEITAFLATRTRAVLAVLDAGAPVGTVADLRLVDGELEVGVDDPEITALLAADDRVCVVADQFPTYYEIRGVVVHGRARNRTDRVGRTTFRLALGDHTSFDFAKLPRRGAGSGTGAADGS